MTHWHVTRHSEDDDPYVTGSIYDALDYAARELNELADHEHDFVSTVASRVAEHPDRNPCHYDEMEAALRSFMKAEHYSSLALNAASRYKQSRASIADRAPLFQEDQVFLAPGDADNPQAKLYQSATWTAGEVNSGSPLSIWSCEAEAGEDDEGALYCRMYEE
jgi:hypothetical protein